MPIMTLAMYVPGRFPSDTRNTSAHCPDCGDRLYFLEDGTPAVERRADLVPMKALELLAAECEDLNDDLRRYEARPEQVAADYLEAVLRAVGWQGMKGRDDVAGLTGPAVDIARAMQAFGPCAHSRGPDEPLGLRFEGSGPEPALSPATTKHSLVGPGKFPRRRYFTRAGEVRDRPAWGRRK